MALGLGLGLGLTVPRGGVAALSLDFLSGALDSRITFTRGSNATLTDSTGKVTYAPSNLLTYSEGAVAQLYTSAGVTDASTSISGFGNSIAFGDNSLLRYAYKTFTTTASVPYVLSIYVQMDNGSAPSIGTTSTTGDFSIIIESAIATTVSSTLISGTVYRVTATIASASGVANRNFGVIKYTGQSARTFRITGFQLEAVTYQTTPGTYVATTSSAYYGPRFDYDPVTLAPKGLLIEEARTNLLTYSSDWTNAAWTKISSSVVAGATTSPDGTVNAQKLVEDTSTAGHQVNQAATTTAAPYTFSVNIKTAGRNWTALGITDSGSTVRISYFDLANGVVGTVATGVTASMLSLGNGWYRCSVTVAAALAGNNTCRIYLSTANNVTSYTGDGTSGIYIWGAQLEAGAFATSYIPTVASTVTRAADVATMTGTNFSAWYNQPTGTFVVSLTPRGVPTGGTNVRFLEVNDGTVTSRNPLMYASSAGTTYTQYRVAGVDQANINSSASYYVANSTITIGAAYAVNDFATSFSGGAVTTDTSGSVVTNASELDIGYARSAAGTEVFNGHIRQIAYYNTRLPNAQLQSLTAPSATTTLSLDFTSGSYTVGY